MTVCLANLADHGGRKGQDAVADAHWYAHILISARQTKLKGYSRVELKECGLELGREVSGSRASHRSSGTGGVRIDRVE